MFYLTCTMISSVDLAHYGISRAKNYVSVDCCTIIIKEHNLYANNELLQHSRCINMYVGILCYRYRVFTPPPAEFTTY